MSAPLPAPVPARPRTSLVGPVVLTVVGVLLLVGALVVALSTAGRFVGLVTSDVLTSDGRPGSAVLAAVDAPGSTTVDLTAGERYAVYVVVPRDTLGEGGRPDLTEDVVLRAPSGETVAADGSPGVNMREGLGDQVAGTVGAFTAPETGTYEMTAPPAARGAWVALAPDKPFLPFFGGVWATVFGVFGVFVLGALGFAVLAGGIVWWVLRVRTRRRLGVS